MLTATIWLQRPRPDVPWGFRLQGGKDYQQPLSVLRVSPGSIASTGLTTGDLILRIGETDTTELTFSQSQDLIKKSGNLLQFQIAKANGPKQQAINSPDNQFATRLDEQLARGPSSQPTSPHGTANNAPSFNATPYSPTSHPGAPDFNYTQAQQPQRSNSPFSSGNSPQHRTGGRAGPGGPKTPQSPVPQIPDAVLNMAARGPPEKKPWAYVPDANALREQRDKVRRRPGGSLPRYQQMMNVPSFGDSAPVRPVSRGSHHTSSSTPEYGGSEPDGMVVHAQYNSPLNLYSDHNVAETFEAQTGGEVAAQRPGGKKNDPDIRQSEVYKMVHGLDKSRQGPRPAPPQRMRSREGPVRIERKPSRDDEITFSGVPSRGDIPSKSFQRLQQQMSADTGSGVDETPIMGGGGGDDEVSDYSEQSIRYRGQKIPSRSFAMLQKMTGGSDAADSIPAVSRRPLRQTSRQRNYDDDDDQNPDDTVDISYVGGAIPSRSFKMLQQSIGQDPQDDQADRAPVGAALSRPPSTDPGGPGELTLDRRRRRRRDRSRQRAGPGAGPGMRGPSPVPHVPASEQQNDFDERAFLAGNVAILRTGQTAPRRAPSCEPSPVSKVDGPKPDRDFDESAYLAGRQGLFGGVPDENPHWKPKVEAKREPEWTTLVRQRRESNDAPFSEEAILNLQQQHDSANEDIDPDLKRLLEKRKAAEGAGIPDPETLKRDHHDQEEDDPTVDPDWKRFSAIRRQSEGKDFDESQFLKTFQERDREGALSPEWKKMVDERRKVVPFDENHILATKEKKVDPQLPIWLTQRRASVDKSAEQCERGVPPSGQRNGFDEDAFLGRSSRASSYDREEEKKPFDEAAFVKGRNPLARSTEPLTPLNKRRRRRPRPPPVAKPDGEVPFDESAFLQGRMNLFGGSVDNVSKPPRGDRPRQDKPAVPWHKEDTTLTDDEFDEGTFLRGGYPALRESVDREVPVVPAKQNDNPRRFRARAPWERDNVEDEDTGQESDADFDESMYLRGRIQVRKNSDTAPQPGLERETFKPIRSRTFARLSRSVSRDNSRANSPSDSDSDFFSMRRTQSEDRMLDGEDSGTACNGLGPEDQNGASPLNDKHAPQRRLKVVQNGPATNDEPVVDIDDAIEKLQISENSPSEYLDVLKKTCEAGRMVSEEDQTDF